MDATISWTANTEPDLAGYKVYHGTSPGVYTDVSIVTAPTTSKVYTGLYDLVPHYFAVSSYDTSGNESSLSVVVQKQAYLRKQTTLGMGSCG